MKKILFILSGMVCCIIIYALFFFIITHHGMRFLPQQKIFSTGQIQNTLPPTTSQPRPTENCAQFPLANGCGVVGFSINICSDQHPNYPPLSEILTTNKDPIIGVYKGKITNINQSLHAITVTSDMNGKSFVFNGGSINGKVFDMHSTQVNDYHILTTGSKAVVSFNCSQRNGYFLLNRFQLIQ